MSSLQLEAIVYGSQRHMTDLPVATEEEAPLPNEAAPAAVSAEAPIPEATTEATTAESTANATDTPPTGTDAVVAKAPAVPQRAGFLLGDSAGMGKGRTLAGFVVENVSRGRKKHVWISVSADLYEDAKRDLRDLGMHGKVR